MIYRVDSLNAKSESFGYPSPRIHRAKNLRGLLWVDEKKEEYVVVLYFSIKSKVYLEYIASCKNGEDHYRYIPAHQESQDISDIVIRDGDSLYTLKNQFTQKLELSKINSLSSIRLKWLLHDGGPKYMYNIAVTTLGEVLLVERILYANHSYFHLYKKDPNPSPDSLIDVDSLGDEAMFLDLGINVPADSTLGIEPNSIYFTHRDRVCHRDQSYLDICVFNLATKTQKRFPELSNLKLTEARWFFQF